MTNELSIDQLLDLLELRRKYITQAQGERIQELVKIATTPATGDETMSDLLQEIQDQMSYLRKFRKQIENKGDTASTREVKDMIQASTSLFSMLTKMNDDINNQDRMRKIENATVEVVRNFSIEDQAKFFSLLEEALAR